MDRALYGRVSDRRGLRTGCALSTVSALHRAVGAGLRFKPARVQTGADRSITCMIPPTQSTTTAAIDAMREMAERWRITWADGRVRTTTLVGLAWYACEFDDDAIVTPVSDE